MTEAKVLGTCYICAKLVWGVALRAGRPYATSSRTRYAVLDERGVRHSTCWQDPDSLPEVGKALPRKGER